MYACLSKEREAITYQYTYTATIIFLNLHILYDMYINYKQFDNSTNYKMVEAVDMCVLCCYAHLYNSSTPWKHVSEHTRFSEINICDISQL